MKLNPTENYLFIASRLNTNIAIAWGHVLNGNPKQFLNSVLMYCSYGGNFLNCYGNNERKELIKILTYYADMDVPEATSPFKDSWQEWAFKLLFALYSSSIETREDVSSNVLKEYSFTKHKFQVLGVM